MEQPEHPEQFVVHIVVTDLQGRDAYGYTDSAGEQIVCADRSVLMNDPVAREAAFRAFVTQAAAAMNTR